jgi:hypothetical protein
MALSGAQTILGKGRPEVVSRIKIRRPDQFNTWDAASAEGRTMANSGHEWNLFLGQEHLVQAEYGGLGEALGLAASPEHDKPPTTTPSSTLTGSGEMGNGGCYE